MANVLTTPESQDSAAVTTKEVAVAKTGNDWKNASSISMIGSKNEIGTSSFIESLNIKQLLLVLSQCRNGKEREEIEI